MTANMDINTMPAQKVGTDWPNRATVRAPTSQSPPFRVAAMTPNGSAMSRAMAVEKHTSFKVLGSRWPMSSTTGFRVRIEVPRSARIRLCTNRPYCMYMGWSSPRSRIISSRRSDEASMGNITSSGFPVSRARVKTSMLITISVITHWSSLPPM